MWFVVNTGSQTDCYVKLWLPTASCREAQTRTVHNCRNPVWNETFHFMIQSAVKVGSETVSRCFLKGASSPTVGRLFLRGLRLTKRILNSVNLTERSSLSSEGCGISGINLNASLCPRTVAKSCWSDYGVSRHRWTVRVKGIQTSNWIRFS